ncbi:MAG: hypothetical protein ABI699_05740 [Caldimonas sp.]
MTFFAVPKLPRAAAALALLVLSGAASSAPGDSVAAPFRGTWVPARSACTAPLQLVIDANVVTFVNGAEKAEFKKLDQCHSCMGHDVQNVSLLSTEAMGDSPFMITLDGTRKGRPGVSVDLGNDKKLAQRFPLGTGALKKCP